MLYYISYYIIYYIILYYIKRYEYWYSVIQYSIFQIYLTTTSFFFWQPFLSFPLAYVQTGFFPLFIFLNQDKRWGQLWNCHHVIPHKTYFSTVLYKCKKFTYSLCVLRGLNMGDIFRAGITEKESFGRWMLNRSPSDLGGKWRGGNWAFFMFARKRKTMTNE